MVQPSYQSDLKLEPYWWEAAPPTPLPQASLLKQVDVLVVGAGFTGLGAAITMAQAGRSVAVLEAQPAGLGASTRNGGQASGTLKVGLGRLAVRFGPAQASAWSAKGSRH